MTVNDIIKAAAVKLGELFPDRLTYYGEIHNEADGNHYIRCINQSHEKRLDRRRARSYSFEIYYFRRDKDALEFNAWAETMYFAFESLVVGGQTLHITGAHAEDGDDGVFHFVFDVDFVALVEPEAAEPMETLDATEVVNP